MPFVVALGVIVVQAGARGQEPEPLPPGAPVPLPGTPPPRRPPPPAPEQPSEPAPVPSGIAAQPAAPETPAVRVAEVKVTGSIDPPGRVEGLIARLVPRGSFYLEPSVLDATGAPVSTQARVAPALERIGYAVSVVARPRGTGEVDLEVKLRALERVRQIFVVGNWPLRQDDILRIVTLEAGQPLPDPGPERDQRIERERNAVLEFLKNRGYFEAKVHFELRTRFDTPVRIDVVLIIDHGPGYPIGPITVEGATAIPKNDIAGEFRRLDWMRLGLRPVPFDRQQLRKDLAAVTQMYRKLGYAMARITDEVTVDPARREVKLRLIVNERKRVEVEFINNQSLSAEELEEALTIFKVGSYSNGEAEASAESIEQLYRSKGHVFVKVTWKADSSGADMHRLMFTIDEGPSLKVREVAIEGARSFPEERLADVVTVREFPWLGFLGIGEGGYVSLRQLELDVERLTGFYHGNGHPGTRVRCEVGPEPGRYVPIERAEAEAARFTDARGLWVRFVIAETPRIDLVEIKLEVAEGRLPLPEALIYESLDGKVGMPYRPSVVTSDTERLRRLLGDAGYPEATVEPLPVDRGPTGKVIVYQIRLGPAQRIGELFLRGNFFTTEGTIRRWTLLEEGDPLTITALERARRNLALIQIIANPNPVRLVDEGDVGGIVPVLVEVEERHDHLGIVRIGGGASTEQAAPGEFPLGAYGALGYEHRNLLGQSWLFTTRGEFGPSLKRIQLEFTNPRLLDTQFRLQFTGSYLSQLTLRLGDVTSGTGTLALVRELTAGVDLAFHYAWRSTARTEFLLRGGGPDSEQETGSIATHVGAVGLTLDWQRLDSPLVPTRGFKLQATLELARPELSLRLGEDTFLKAGVRMLNVLPLSRRVSLRHSIRYDQGFPLAGSSLLPKVERFFAGGDTTLRGFEVDRARTDRIKIQLGPDVTRTQYRPLGGSLRVLDNLDLQVQILGPWFASVFLDSGVLADAFDELSPSRFRHGVGIAPAVIKLPVGDVSIAWGWPLDPEPGDSVSGRLHFNVGLMF